MTTFNNKYPSRYYQYLLGNHTWKEVIKLATYRKRNDKWEYRISYQDPFTMKRKVKSKSGFSTKKEAQAAATDMEKQLEDGIQQTDMKLETYLYTWLKEYKEGTIRRNTYLLHENNIKTRIIPYFKNITIKKLTPMLYQKFINHLKDERKYSRRTIEIVHRTMHGAFDQAVKLDLLTKNPTDAAIIKGEVKKQELKYLETDNIKPLLEEIYRYGYEYWIFFKVLFDTGMRKGEAAALQWSDIDWKDNTININKSLDFTLAAHDKIAMFGETKTYNSIRKIKMSKSLTNDLLEHRKYLNRNKLILNDLYDHESNLVLCRSDGRFIPKSSLFNAFSKCLERAGFSKLPIHSTRHTHAVMQLEAGADMKYVQERLGHGSIQITSDVYAHISDKIEEQRIDKYEEYTKNLF